MVAVQLKGLSTLQPPPGMQERLSQQTLSLTRRLQVQYQMLPLEDAAGLADSVQAGAS